MSAQPENNQQMEGVQNPADVKGKGKAQEGETIEESMDDDSSDESGVEDQVRSTRSPLQVKAQKANMMAYRLANVSYPC
ncbi:hypothetical protein A1F99_074530 [Pyrenophora tritici-repentis]|nr:hypothetical protein A1F99_074530 [Pyrenophora tritici-repentis]